MATNFDFDRTFNEDPEDENMAEATVDTIDDEEDEDEEAEAPARPNRLRLIILLLFVLLLVCAVCYFLPSRLGIPIPGLNPAPTEVVSVPPTAPATEEPPAPTEPTAPPVVETEEPGTLPPGEATEEPTAAPTEESQPEATEEPQEQPGDGAEPTTEPTTEPTVEPTTEPVTGATATLVPTAVLTSTTCPNNVAPIAKITAPATAMMGKGEAVVSFDGSGSSDPDGTIVKYEWDFGDSSNIELNDRPTTTHAYKKEGGFTVTLRVMDNCGDTTASEAQITITGPTPPASDGGNNQATPTPTATPTGDASGPANATMGFCHKVQRGETLSGLAQFYGRTLYDLARVNNVTTTYYILVDQGLFIPSGEIKNGPNAYQVQKGDTLSSLAFQCGLTTRQLAQANQLALDSQLSPGQVVVVPIGWR
jgi:LysM repeat protein/outer membrane biosynthesis protein TonB